MIDRRRWLSLTGLYACLILRAGGSADRSVPRAPRLVDSPYRGGGSFRQSGEMGGGGTVVTAGGGGAGEADGACGAGAESGVFFFCSFFFVN